MMLEIATPAHAENPLRPLSGKFLLMRCEGRGIDSIESISVVVTGGDLLMRMIVGGGLLLACCV